MARLQDFQTVTPTSSDKLLVVQSQGQGLVPYGSKLDSANPTGTGKLSLNRKSGSAEGANSVAEGLNCTASGDYGSHAEGYNTTASGTRAHSEGHNTTASGNYGSHSEGSGTTASGTSSHSEGEGTTASGYIAHSEGLGTKANRRSQHVFGEYNVEETGSTTTKGTYIEIVGNGTSTTPSNARTLDWSGNEVLAGDLTINGNQSVSAGLKWGFYVPATTGSTVKINCSNYKILIIMGIFQQVGVKCFIVNISGGVLTVVKDLVTGEVFTNVTNLSFAFANQVLTITCVSGSHFNVYGEDISRGT